MLTWIKTAFAAVTSGSMSLWASLAAILIAVAVIWLHGRGVEQDICKAKIDTMRAAIHAEANAATAAALDAERAQWAAAVRAEADARELAESDRLLTEALYRALKEAPRESAASLSPVVRSGIKRLRAYQSRSDHAG